MNTQNITHYYLDFGYSTATKNKLQNEAHAYLKSLNGKLIVASDLIGSIGKIIDTINSINEKNPRCKPLLISISLQLHNKCFTMRGFEAVCFNIRPAELTHITSLTVES